MRGVVVRIDHKGVLAVDHTLAALQVAPAGRAPLYRWPLTGSVPTNVISFLPMQVGSPRFEYGPLCRLESSTRLLGLRIGMMGAAPRSIVPMKYSPDSYPPVGGDGLGREPLVGLLRIVHQREQLVERR